METVANCPLCGKKPKLMVSPGFFYECCNIMGSFPPATTKVQAMEDWNVGRLTEKE